MSAYALFFRDMQSSIKAENPEASFGEISKIVANQWDSLDDAKKTVSSRSPLSFLGERPSPSDFEKAWIGSWSPALGK